MDKDKDREKIKADDNYAGLYKAAYHGLKDVITDFMGLYLELQQSDLEDTRVSTRIADRFQNLSCANDKNELLRERVNALKPFMHTTNPEPRSLKVFSFNKYIYFFFRFVIPNFFNFSALSMASE